MVDATTNCHRKTATPRLIVLSSESFSATENCLRTTARTHVIVLYPGSFSATRNCHRTTHVIVNAGVLFRYFIYFSSVFSTMMVFLSLYSNKCFQITFGILLLLRRAFSFSMFDLNRSSPKMGPSLAQFTRKDIMGSVFETTKRLTSLRWPTDNC
jgi:hypothetical protein